MSFIVLTIFTGGMADGSKYRLARTLTVTRVNAFNPSSEMLPLSPSAHAQKQKRTASENGMPDSRVRHSYQPANTDQTEIEPGFNFADDDGYGSHGEHEGPEVFARRMV
jgi:hypothetical protein